MINYKSSSLGKASMDLRSKINSARYKRAPSISSLKKAWLEKKNLSKLINSHMIKKEMQVKANIANSQLRRRRKSRNQSKI